MLATIIPAAVGLVGRVIDLIPDANKKAEMVFEMQKLQMASVQAQVELNKIEAGHKNIFVAGWRPAVGWVCAAGFAWQTIVAPLVMWAVAVWSPGTPLPELDPGVLLETTFALLGLGAFRTYEKKQGLTRSLPGANPAPELPVPPPMPVGDWMERRNTSG